MSEPILSAIIGAFVAGIGILLKDIAYPLWRDKNQTLKEKQEIFESYARPFSLSTQSLFWRLEEILHSSRGAYLSSTAPKSIYNIYKLDSTAYRLSAFLGWSRAIKRELAFLDRDNEEYSSGIYVTMEHISSLLADGSHVEENIFYNILEAFDLDRQQFHCHLPSEISAALNDYLFINGLKDLRELINISDNKKEEIAIRISEIINSSANSQLVSPRQAIDIRHNILECVAVKERWIYRDWQDAIGDMMIHQGEGKRKYEVIGYGEFQSIKEGSSQNSVWIDRVLGFFEDIDISQHKIDMRVDQLRDIQVKIGELLCLLKERDSGAPIIASETISKARERTARNR